MGSFWSSLPTALHGTVWAVVPETVSLDTIDGVRIEADLVRVDAIPARGCVVIGHPHPLYGGDRHNHVVRSLQVAAANVGLHSIAVDFRGVGNSGGVHDDGDSERLDLAAACELAELVEPDTPIVMAGYSFGSVVAMNVSHPWIAGWIAVAPPLPMMGSRPTAASNPRPKVLLAPEHDQFTPPSSLRLAVGDWSNTEIILMPGVDHFIAADAPAWCSTAVARVLQLID